MNLILTNAKFYESNRPLYRSRNRSPERKYIKNRYGVRGHAPDNFS